MLNEDYVFDRAVGMDIMIINSKSVFHVVDNDEEFSAATFIKGESRNKVWEPFPMCSVARYIRFQGKVVLNQGSQLHSSEFKSLLYAAGIDHIDAGIERHNAMGETERYHSYLQFF